MTFEDAASAIAAAGRRMDAMGWVPATAGNISIRLAPDEIAITRSGRHKGLMTAADVMAVDAAGAAARSRRQVVLRNPAALRHLSPLRRGRGGAARAFHRQYRAVAPRRGRRSASPDMNC